MVVANHKQGTTSWRSMYVRLVWRVSAEVQPRRNVHGLDVWEHLEAPFSRGFGDANEKVGAPQAAPQSTKVQPSNRPDAGLKLLHRPVGQMDGPRRESEEVVNDNGGPDTVDATFWNQMRVFLVADQQHRVGVLSRASTHFPSDTLRMTPPATEQTPRSQPGCRVFDLTGEGPSADFAAGEKPDDARVGGP